ncbi:MAG: hypothetical protein SGILL_009859 [Bacillariaceae sp.]
MGVGWRLASEPDLSFTAVDGEIDKNIIKQGRQFDVMGHNGGVTKVTVGNIGPKIAYARRHGLLQRNQGSHWSKWPIIENDVCLNTTTSTTGNKKNPVGFAALTSSTPTSIIRQHYLPEAILIGVQKGGTTALYTYIDQHPAIAESQKELYFLDEKVDQAMLRNYEKQQSTTGGIPQLPIRQAYSQTMKTAMKHPKRDEGKMILDLTPNYIYQSDRLPARIACVLPWAKVMALLRDPVERARSQYDMKVRFHGNPQPNRKAGRNSNGNGSKAIVAFSQYIRNDLAALQETGVIQDWTKVDFDTFFESSAMDEAWRTYMNSGMNAPIGMSLYAIQLKPFLELPNEFMAIQSEKLMKDTDETYGKVLDFLGLERISLKSYPKANNAGKQKKTSIDPETEALLRNVFDPFNQKLGELLGKEWKGVWDDVEEEK